MDGARYLRRRVAADTDASIARAEQLRSAQLQVPEALTAAGHSTRRAVVLSKLTEDRLKQLQKSRDYLVGAEPRLVVN
jgi:hypothetical protein